MTNDMQPGDDPSDGQAGSTHPRWKYLAEAVVGLGLGVLVVWTLIAANGEVPFVYQGL